jgi:hypothetical protein
MQNSDNPELDLAMRIVESTGASLFLTGKAGTGKTTFLRKLRTQSPKRMVVVAPTGVAAMNAGGVTIHSLFQLPFGPIVPGHRYEVSRFTREKINIIRTIDLLVIDEISMVRADVLDGISDVLRRFRDPGKPFGGLQLLMIGDLHQLSPVVRDEDWTLLRGHYGTPYFFSSLALRQISFESVELQKVYRQSDASFLDLLNQVRDNCMDDACLLALNARYQPDFFQGQTEGYITLTTHNNQAQKINQSQLDLLPGHAETFPAAIEGEFAEANYPTEKNLVLKIGAQVMFLRNDSEGEKRYFNGKIGRVKSMNSEGIKVECDGDGSLVLVEPVDWENTKYQVNEETKEIESEILGTFKQYPLKLAWAITIHKSQGLTFEKAIIEASASFAHGQVYVALSRCKTLEGLVLSSPLHPGSVISDASVNGFSKSMGERLPNGDKLQSLQLQYQEDLLRDLFDFSQFVRHWGHVSKIVQENERVLRGIGLTNLGEIHLAVRINLLEVGNKFKAQLHRLVLDQARIEGNKAIEERVHKACAYFLEKVNEQLDVLENLSWRTDNKDVKKNLSAALEHVAQFWKYKSLCIIHPYHNGFRTKNYLSTRATALIDSSAFKLTVVTKSSGDDLHSRLIHWRSVKADQWGVEPHQVLPQNTLEELTRKAPQTMENLVKVKGFGKKKTAEFGREVILLVRKYMEDNGRPFVEELIW